jgi:hypothetical protein
MATFAYVHRELLASVSCTIMPELVECNKDSSEGDSGGCADDDCSLCLRGNDRLYMRIEESRVRWLLKMQAERTGNSDGLGLMKYLMYVHCLAASDPRDLRYAYLGLSGNNYGIQPYYSDDISIEDILVDLSRGIHRQHVGLNTFYQALLYRGRKDPKIPSWVTDWRQIPCNMESYRPGSTKTDQSRIVSINCDRRQR